MADYFLREKPLLSPDALLFPIYLWIRRVKFQSMMSSLPTSLSKIFYILNIRYYNSYYVFYFKLIKIIFLKHVPYFILNFI